MAGLHVVHDASLAYPQTIEALHDHCHGLVLGAGRPRPMSLANVSDLTALGIGPDQWSVMRARSGLPIAAARGCGDPDAGVGEQRWGQRNGLVWADGCPAQRQGSV